MTKKLRATDMLPIGDIADRTGLAVSAIRYYEEEGLIKPQRNRGGQRRFQRSDIRRLSFVLIAQQLGFTIAQIRQQLNDLPDGRNPTKADWTKLSKKFRADIDTRLDTLTRLRDKLDGCIGCGCLSLQKCRLYNPQDRAKIHGQGPRFVLEDISSVE